MDWNFDILERAKRYKLLVGLVVPRPIALETTLGLSGVVNAAPFSFFNVLGDDPPIVVISIEDRDSGTMKDSARNITDSGEFVVNLVDEAIAKEMHACSVDFPPDMSELDAVGLTLSASVRVRPPRIAEAPAALECTLHSRIDIQARHLLIGQVRHMHVREGIVDPATFRVEMDDYHPVGRLFANRYTRTRDQFSLEANDYVDRMRKAGRA